MKVWAVGSKRDVIQCYPSGCVKNNDKHALDLVSHILLYSENNTVSTTIYTLCFAFKEKVLNIIFQSQDRFPCDHQFRFNVWKVEVKIFDDYGLHLRLCGIILREVFLHSISVESWSYSEAILKPSLILAANNGASKIEHSSEPMQVWEDQVKRRNFLPCLGTVSIVSC